MLLRKSFNMEPLRLAKDAFKITLPMPICTYVLTPDVSILMLGIKNSIPF